MVNYGLQLYSLRDMTENDFEGALSAAAELGYSSIEFAGFFDHSAAEVRAMLDRYGLTVSSTHTGWRDLLPEKIDETIRYHRELGCDSLIVPSGSFGTPEKRDAFMALLAEVQPKLAEAGIKLGYHNHAHEFLPNDSGIVSFPLLEAFEPLELEIDVYWAHVAGVDPVELIRRLRDRIRFIHVKDGTKEKGLAVGEGEVDIPAIRELALELGINMIVESEGCDPTGVEEVGRSIRYLRTLEK